MSLLSKLFGSNVISTVQGRTPLYKVAANPVQNRGLYASLNSLNRTYGQSPAVADWCNAHELLGVTKYNEIGIA